MDVLGEWIKQPASVEERKLSLPFPTSPRDIEGRHRPFSPVVRKPLTLLFFFFFLPGPWTPAEVSSKEIGMGYNIASLFPSSCHSETPTVLMS